MIWRDGKRESMNGTLICPPVLHVVFIFRLWTLNIDSYISLINTWNFHVGDDTPDTLAIGILFGTIYVFPKVLPMDAT